MFKGAQTLSFLIAQLFCLGGCLILVTLVGNDVIVHRYEQNLYHSASCAFPNTMPQKHLCFSLKKTKQKILKYLRFLDTHKQKKKKK